MSTMVASGAEAFRPVLQALATLQGNLDREQKQQANDYLEAFQKSVGPSKPLQVVDSEREKR